MFWSLVLNLNVWLIKVTHAVLIISIIGLFAGTIFGKIPFVKMYIRTIQWVSLFALIGSIFLEGYFYASKSWMEKVKEMEDKIAIAEKQSKETNDVLEEKTKKLNQQIKDNQKELQGRIKKEQKKIDKLCENHIVWGKPNGLSYNQISFKGKTKFTDIDEAKEYANALFKAKNIIASIEQKVKRWIVCPIDGLRYYR